jgi:hypothetical protein
MQLFKKDKKKIYHSFLYTFPIVITSAVFGIIGFNLSFTQDKDLVSLYIYSTSFSFFFQIITYSILNHKKNSIINRFKYTINIRNSIIQFIVLNIIIIYSASLIIWFLVSGTFGELAFFILLQLIFSYLQMLTFNNTIYFQLKDIEYYLKGMFFSTIGRVIGILVLIYLFKLSFYGLIFSNIISSIVILLFYKIKLRQLIDNYKLGLHKINYFSNVLKIEGILRSYRGYSEAWLLTTIISVLNITRILRQPELDLINFSVPYVNSVSVSFRQIYLKFERESYFNNLKRSQFLISYLTLVPLIFLYLFKDNFIILIEKYHFYSLRMVFDSYFLKMLTLQLILLPFTFGFVYVDFSKKNIYYKFLIYQFSTLIILIFTIIFLYKFLNLDFIFILIPLLPIFSIAINKKYLVEKYL